MSENLPIKKKQQQKDTKREKSLFFLQIFNKRAEQFCSIYQQHHLVYRSRVSDFESYLFGKFDSFALHARYVVKWRNMIANIGIDLHQAKINGGCLQMSFV